jgi:flagellin
LTALQSLNATNKALETTQSRISTGYRVASASDNAAYWSIATTMRSDNKANSVLQDALGLGAGKIDTAYTAINSAIDVVDQIKEKVLLAKTSSSDDRAKIQSEISSLQAQLTDNIGGANYAGSNLLKTDSASTTSTKLTVMTSYNRDSAGAVTTGTIEVNFDDIRLIDSNATPAGMLDKAGTASGAGLLAIDVTDVTGVTGYDATDEGASLDALLTDIETALGGMATGAASLGAAKARVDMQKDFVSKLSDSIDRGVGQLVDADMNKESTRLQALQVQQQLGIQSLSIANGNTQSILSLFRG